MNTPKMRISGFAMLCSKLRNGVLLFAGTVGLWALPVSAQDILIFRPLENNQKEYLISDERLLTVPGGRMYLFEVEISAFTPIQAVSINGRSQPQAYGTWMVLRSPLLLRPGANRIRVEAHSMHQSVEKEFNITLVGLPGFGFEAPKKEDG